MRQAGRSVLLSLLTLTLASCSWLGGTPEGQGEQLVYWPLVSNGERHQRVPYPIQAGPIRVLAGTPVVLEARIGEVSFWPITREYIAQFDDGRDEEGGFIKGELNLVDSSGRVRQVPSVDFVESYRDGVGRSASEILVGREALDRYQQYLEESNDALTEQRAYQEVVAAQQLEVERWLEAAAQNPDNPPPAPNFELIDPPEPYLPYVSKPRKAPVVNLSPGTYEMHLLDGRGNVVDGSHRRIESIAPTAVGVGYELLPEQRWTQPENAFDPDAVIYTTGEFGFYLSPAFVEAYPASDYARLFRPQLQDAPGADEVVWVPVPAERREATGALLLGGASPQTISKLPYAVSPVPGASRGYEITEAGKQEGSDFSAMYVAPGGDAESLALVESEGIELPGSHRNIRAFRLEQEAFLFLPAALPLAIAFAVRRSRRSR